MITSFLLPRYLLVSNIPRGFFFLVESEIEAGYELMLTVTVSEGEIV
jgi:hypothetical protein